MARIKFTPVNRYIVTSPLGGGELEVTVPVTRIVEVGERQAVCEATWFEVRCSASKILESMFSRYGQDKVKAVFFYKLTFDSQRRKM